MGLNIQSFVGAVVGIIVAVENRKSLSSCMGFGSLSRYGGHRNSRHFVQRSSRHGHQLCIHKQYVGYHPASDRGGHYHGSGRFFPVCKEGMIGLVPM